MAVKILFLIDKLMPAGTQTNLLEIVKRLDRSRFDPRVIALVEGDEFVEEFDAIGVEPIILNMKKIFGFSGLKTLSFLVRYLSEEKIDIVQTYFLQADILGSLAGKFARVKRIVTTRRDEGFWRTRRQLALNRYFNRFADRVLVNSQAVGQAAHTKEEISSRKIHMIYNGVDLNKYYPSQELREQARLEFGIAGDEFVVGMVANMRHEVKGHRFLLKAISLLKKEEKKVKVLLVGDGPLETRFENYAVHRGVFDQTLFLGSRRDVSALMNAMDVVCAPSLSEGFSNTILEAMAIGKPVIATNVGGNSEAVVYGETGFLVRPRDGAAIAEKILFFLENKETCSEWGLAGLKRVQSQFTIEKMIEEYQQFYEKLLERKKVEVRRRKVEEKEERLKKDSGQEFFPSSAAPSTSSQEALKPVELKTRPAPAPYHRSRRIRVLYLIWSLDLGGAEQVVVDLARRLSKQNFKPMICCLNDKGRLSPLVEKEGIKVFALHKKPKFDPFLISKLIDLIKREKVDLIHTHLFTANLWGRIAGKLCEVPVVSSEHGMDHWRRGFHWALDRMLTSVSKGMVFVSESAKRFYSEKNPSVNGKSRVIHNGIEIANFQNPYPKEEIRKSLGIAIGEQVIGIVGRLVPEKAHEDFIEAIQLLAQEKKNILGLIIGEGELSESLKKLVQQIGLEQHILFAGYRSDLVQLYHSMDVLVLSSLREGLPLTLLEGMAAGVPVVATDVGGIKEVIKDGEDGVLVPPNDPAALANAISRILDDSILRERVVSAAKEKVKNYFSVEKMVNDHELLYAEVLTS